MARRLFILILFFLSSFCLHAGKYRIAGVHYDILGITKEYAIQRNIEIDTSRVFHSYEELHLYIKDLEQQFSNQRVFSTSLVNLSYDLEEQSEITPVHIHVFTADSKHLLIVPYPKYDSNTGVTLKLKAKDTNFLGTMNTMNADLNFFSGNNNELDEYQTKLGLSFSYDYPFNIRKIKSSWNNSLSFDYVFGKSRPEFNFSTGFTFILPYQKLSFSLTLTQSIVQNLDYTKYNDELYFTESAVFAVPVTLQKIDNWGNVTWTPAVSYVFNWDHDGIAPENTALSSPLLSFQHTISTSRVNWIGNFRDGLSATAGQSIAYNFQTDQIIPKVWGELIGYKAAFKYVGFSGRIYAFAITNGKEKIGSKLRGIRDEVTYQYSVLKALEVPVGVVLNFDMPIHVISTDWTGWTARIFGEESKVTKALHFMRYLDFELQLSPFVDFALTKNAVTGRLLDIRDGFYCAGIEAIVFPNKWRSIEVRASLGVDVGRKVLKKVSSKLFDDSWRTGSSYELYIGIGLHY